MSFDIKRIALLLGLFGMGYWIVLTWEKDYGDASQTTQTATPPGTPSTTPSGAPSTTVGSEGSLGALDLVAPPGNQAGSDVPDVVLDAPAGQALATPSAASTSDWVSVETPLYRLWIDLHGGDIVRADLKQFPISLNQPDLPIALLDLNQRRTYIAQSGLRSEQGPDSSSSRPLYRSAQRDWVMAEDEAAFEVALLWSSKDGVQVQKIYRLHRDQYQIQTRFEVRNDSQQTWRGHLFAQIKHDGKSSSVESDTGLGPRPYQGTAFTTDDDNYLKLDFDDLAEQKFQADVEGGWVSVLQHYFLSAWVPQDTKTYRYYGQQQSSGGNYLVGLIGPEVSAAAGGGRALFEATLYIGPKIQSDLAALAKHLDLAVDYGFLWWLAQPLFWLMALLQSWVGNWGLAIVLLTLIVKLVLYPLSAAAYKSMANMRRVAPELKRLQSLHEGDRQKLSQAMMGLYKREKINPMGGCFPMLLQMPVFLALYWVLYESVELRHAPLIFWIQDLAAKDPYFVLPILMGITMYLQQTLNPPVPDPMQARVLQFMPIVFTVFFLFFPSGLVLYWLTNNVLSIAQQYWINRRLNAG